MQAPRILQTLLDWKARLTSAKAIAGQSSAVSQTDIEAKIAVDQSTVQAAGNEMIEKEASAMLAAQESVQGHFDAAAWPSSPAGQL